MSLQADTLTFEEAGKPTDAAIQAIKRGDVHRITSGQVILDIQSAVKELIENALDAGATTIEVRFKEYGAETVEVLDNGSGISSDNHDSLALKHHTSKLKDFGDLVNVNTFGFRGEALSSLCELGRVQVVTATQDEEPIGTVLELARDGTVAKRDKKAARQRGTTVIVADLFHTLPVRRKELLKNIKREFAKAQTLLQAYAVITRGVRWVVTNSVKGRKTPVMTIAASDAPAYLSSNVTAIFGPKVSAQLVPLDLRIPISSAHLRAATADDIAYREDVGDVREHDADGTAAVRVQGVISRPAIGYGRAASDRCFLYVNGRPWDASKVVRAFNEVYRAFNMQQYPMVVANFEIQGHDYDVNVSPDKRTLFLYKEGEIIERLKVQLENMFIPFQSHFKVNGPASPQHPTLPFKSVAPPEDSDESAEESVWAKVDVSRFANGRRRRDSSPSGHSAEEDERQAKHVRRSAGDGEQAGPTPISTNSRPDPETSSHGSPSDDSYVDQTSPVASLDAVREQSPDLPLHERSSFVPRTRSITRLKTTPYQPTNDQPRAAASQDSKPSFACRRAEHKESLPQQANDGDQQADGANEGQTNFSKTMSEHEKDGAVDVMACDEDEPRESSCGHDVESRPTPIDGRQESDEVERAEHLAGLDEGGDSEEKEGWKDEFIHQTVREDGHGSLRLDFDLSTIVQRLESRPSLPALRQNRKADHINRTDVGNAAVEQKDEQVAEAALSRFIEKADFEKMYVVGQFNLGFILVRRTSSVEDDVFIVDQHAADEKFNFERLTASTKLHGQRLIAPRTLQLSPADELVAAEHGDALAAHGFEVRVDEDAPPGSRVTLVALPMSEHVAFGVEDLEEILHRLADEQPHSERAKTLRCSKLRALLASRACRRSVMIGTALTTMQMQTIVQHMGHLDQPWHCPHGRPTMRHLFDLKRAENGSTAEAVTQHEASELDWQALL